MGRFRKALYFLLGAVVVGLTGFAVVDSWIEALALGPVLVLLAWLMARAWWLIDDLELLEQRYARLSELNRENLAQLELAQLRVDALGLMGFRLVWLNAVELEQLAERVKAGKRASPHLSTWRRARSRLPFLVGRGLNEQTARVWPVEVAEAERLGRGIPSIEAIVSARSMTYFAPVLTDAERSSSS